MSTISSYKQIAANLAKWQGIVAKKPEVAAQTKYFKAHIGAVKSAADLVKNPRLFTYAMNAFGLADKISAKAMMQKALEQGVASDTALANKLNNANIKAFVKAFDFKTNGANTTASATLVKNVVDRYVENSLETDQQKQNPGVELALYFKRTAPGLTSVYSILADKKLLTVVQTALGISPMTAAQPVDTQKHLLEKKLKLADFKDATKLDKFIARFAANYDMNNGDPTGAGYTAASAPNVLLFSAASDGSAGLDQSLLLSLQSRARLL